MLQDVIKKDTRVEAFSKQKLLDSLEPLFKKYNVPVSELIDKVSSLTQKTIPTKDLTKMLIRESVNLTVLDPKDYNKLNWRFVASNLKYLEIKDEFNKNPDKLNNMPYVEYLEYMIRKGLYSNILLDRLHTYYTEEELNSFFDHHAGFQYSSKFMDFDYSAMNLFSSRYLIKDNDRLVETPIILFITLALTIAVPEIQENRLVFAARLFKALLARKISLATPIILNLRKPSGSLSSCFIGSAGDDLLSIYSSITNMAKISQNAGGTALNVSNIRASGATIRNIKGASKGVMSWVKLFDDTLLACDQLNSRNGAGTVALDVWHLDLKVFLDSQKENGDLAKKTYRIQPQICIPDEFMRRVEADQDWYLFDPHEIKTKYGMSLPLLYGDHFSTVYNFLITEANNKKIELFEVDKAKDLFKKILKTAIRKGRPYIFFKDTVNNLNPNKHVGMIPNSNLCVAPETQILTDKGYYPIIDLVDQSINVWNGKEWSETKVLKTGEDQELMKITVESFNYSTGRYKVLYLDSTLYHKFYDKDNVEYQAKDLKVGMELLSMVNPEGERIHYRIVETELTGRISDTYCFNEPKRHMGVFNGVLTGQCTESFSNVTATEVISEKLKEDNLVKEYKSGEYHTCDLISLVLTNIDNDEELQDCVDLSVNALDNIIDLGVEPIKESTLHHNRYRILGVGSLGLADWLVKNKLTYSTGQNKIKELSEKIGFYSIQSSIRLSKERGFYPLFPGSEWSKGVVFGKDKNWFESNNTYIDSVKWLNLLEELKEHGIRNGGLLAIAPNTSTSLLMGATASYHK